MNIVDDLLRQIRDLERQVRALQRQEVSLSSSVDHGSIAGLTDDDHTGYALLAGRSGGQRITGIASTGYALEVYRDLAAASTNSAVFAVTEDNTDDDQTAVRVQQDGTGDILQLLDGATEVLVVEDGGVLDIGSYGTGATAFGGTPVVKIAGDANDIVSLQMQNKSTGTGADARLAMFDGDKDSYIAFALPGKNFSGTLFGVNRKDAGFLFTNWTTLTRMLVLGTVGATDLIFGTSNTERVRVTSGGNVHIGGSAANAKFNVTQSTLGSEVMRIESTATNDDPRESVYQQRAATTDATVTTLWSMAVPASTTVGIEAWIVARRTGGSSGTAEDGAFYTRASCVKNVAGTATIIGAGDPAPVTTEDQAGWDCTIDVSGGDVRVRVTGAANNSIVWHATVRTWVVSS